MARRAGVVVNAAGRLGLGTAQLGMSYGIANDRLVSREESLRVLDAAMAAGVRVIDTAVVYGKAESRIGEFLCERADAEREMRVVSKLPPLARDPGTVMAAVRASLDRIGIQRLYGLLVHSAGELIGTGGGMLWRALEDVREQGIVTRIGVSVYEPRELVEIATRCDLDLVQIPCSVFDQRFLAGNVLSDLRAQGVEIHARSVFLQGLLLLAPAEARRRLDETLGRRAEVALEQFRSAAAERGLRPLEVCLRFVVDCALIDKAIVGVNSLAELHQVLAVVTSAMDGAGGGWEALSRDDDLVDPRRWH